MSPNSMHFIIIMKIVEIPECYDFGRLKLGSHSTMPSASSIRLCKSNQAQSWKKKKDNKSRLETSIICITRGSAS